MKRFWNLKLRDKISLFTSMMVGVSLLILTTITIMQERRSSKEELEGQALILLETLPYTMRDELYFLEVDELRDVATKIGQSENIERFVIYDQNGSVLADSGLGQNDDMVTLPKEPDPFGQAIVALSPDERPLEEWIPENQQFTVGSPVYLNNQLIGAASITISTKPLDEKINSLFFQSMALALAIITLGILLSIVLSKRISNPIRELMKVSREMANGDTSIRVAIKSTDEVGELGLAFNEMTEAIQTRQRALRNLTASLEEKVEERTEELRQRNAELTQMAVSDPLTKINNRRYFFDLAGKEYERAQRYQHPLSLILADADHFKNANDTYGHLVGDQILTNLARFLVSNVRSVDVVARYGGEEFVILMPEIDETAASQTAERLRKVIETLSMVDGQDIHITVSFGVACWDGKKDMSFETLLYRADQALYLAKEQGRNRVATWGSDLISNA